MANTRLKEGKAPRAARVRTEREDAILRAAVVEFSSSGLKGATVQSIADRAGLQKRQVLYFFGTKELLYEQVLKRIFSMWQRLSPADWDQSPREIISTYIENELEYARVNPEQSKLMSAEMLGGGDHAMRILRDRSAKSEMKRIVALIEECVADGSMYPVDPYLYIFQIWSSHHFYATYLPEVQFHLRKEKLSSEDWQRIVDHSKRHALLWFKDCAEEKQ